MNDLPSKKVDLTAVDTIDPERPVTEPHRAVSESAAAVDPKLRENLESLVGRVSRCTLLLRGDSARGLAMTTIEGVICELRDGADGRTRVVIRIGPEANQIVPLDRIVRVVKLDTRRKTP